jgi:spore maturation protein CgeB
MKPLPLRLRKQLRSIKWLFELVRAKRARRQEEEYVGLREHYYRKAGPIFAEPGWKPRSFELLRQRWTGPRQIKSQLSDVRMFVVAADDLCGSRILDSLEECCDTVVFDLRQYRTLSNETEWQRAESSLEKWRPRMQRDIVATFNAVHTQQPIDVVFAYGSYFDFDPETLRAMSVLGAPVVDLCLDDKHIFLPKNVPWPNGQKPLIGAVDVHLTNSPDSMRWYIGEGSPAYFMPEGVNPKIFRQMNVEKTMDVCFVGQRYGMRGRLVDTLRAADIQVTCFGGGWGAPPITDAEKVEMYNRARINLGIGGTGVSERMTCIKGRDFEVPVTGSLYLTTFNPELTSLYDIGKEILCYINEIDCVEVVRYYLERPEEAKAIGEAGRARCVRDHTWANRMIGLLKWMEILADGE